MKIGGSVGYVNVYQRVETPLTPIKPRFSYGFPLVFLWFSYGFPIEMYLQRHDAYFFGLAGYQVTSIVEDQVVFSDKVAISRSPIVDASDQRTNDATYVYLYNLYMYI